MSIKDRKHEIKWFGRSLDNYINMHPKAKGATTLTEARALAFGKKHKRLDCRCGQSGCKRQSGRGGSNC